MGTFRPRVYGQLAAHTACAVRLTQTLSLLRVPLLGCLPLPLAPSRSCAAYMYVHSYRYGTASAHLIRFVRFVLCLCCGSSEGEALANALQDD